MCAKRVAVKRTNFNPVPPCAPRKQYHVPYHVPSCALSVPSDGTKAIKRIQDGYRNAWDYLGKANRMERPEIDKGTL